jgi:DNA-binding NarL/FixJ family response regulator
MTGFLSLLKNDPPAARAWLGHAIATARTTGQRELLSEALAMASVSADGAGDHTSARAFLDEAQAAVADLDYAPGLLAVLQARTLHEFAEGNVPAARAAAVHGAELARASGDLYGQEMMALNLGAALLVAGNIDAARPALAEALRIARQIDDRVSLVYLLAALSCHAALSQQAPLAARLLGAAETARTTTGITLLPQFVLSLPATEERVAATLGETRFRAEIAAGRQLTRATAITLALGEPAEPQTAGREATAPTPLSARETEIARLVSDGLTNKQIASRLFLSDRTVDSHVSHILTKIGCTSRAQIATWVTARGDEPAA